MKRNYGIDALKLISMLLVVTLHTIGYGGGLLYRAVGAEYAILLLIETIAYCAVDCFAIISGYVSYSKKDRRHYIERIIELWISVVFYSAIFEVGKCLINHESASITEIIKVFMPITMNRYWYFSCYIALLLILPVFNGALRKMSDGELSKCVWIIAVFSIYCTAIGGISDPFRLVGGYSFVWITFLYVIGTWIKRCNVGEHVNGKTGLVISIFCIFITWGSVLLLTKVISNDSYSAIRNTLLSYTSPTVLGFAVILVCYFSKLVIHNVNIQKALRFLAPASFGVYLINANVTDAFKGKMTVLSDGSLVGTLLRVLSVIMIQFVIALLVERLRMKLFDILRIRSIAEHLVGKIQTVFKH